MAGRKVREREDAMNLIVEREGTINPMDRDAVAFDVTDVGHLSFREVADVGKKVVEHGLIGAYTIKVASDMAIFETVAFETLSRDALLQETSDLVDHTVIEALSETSLDAGDKHRTREGYGESQVAHRREDDTVGGMVMVILLYFESADETVARLGVGMIVQFDESGEASDKNIIGAMLDGTAESGVDRSIRQRETTQDRIDVHACTAAKDRLRLSGEDGIESGDKIVLETIEVIFVAGITDIDKMIGDRAAG